MAEVDPQDAFAAVYDVIYDNPAYLGAQIAFLAGKLPGGQNVLDAGCGTGRHLAALALLGHRVTGLDASMAMLLRAKARLASGRQAAGLVLGRLPALPFAPAFDAILCLESPLAYLHGDHELAAALAEFQRVLRPGGLVGIDLFDYVGTLGPDPVGPQRSRFPSAWGSVEVVERHHFARGPRIWHMRQAFVVRRGGEVERFAVEHQLRVRSADDYAAAVEAAGFRIDELLPAYPGSPPETSREQRLIFVARRR